MLLRINLIGWLFLLLSTFHVYGNDNKSVVIFIRDDVYDDYSRFLNGRKPIEVKDFSGAYIRRDVVDMIIAQQALSLGGFTKPFRYHKGNVNYRNTKLLEDGQLLLSFDSVWSVDAKQLADFKQLTAVSTPRWQTDWQTLSDLPLKELLREDEWLGQVRTVSMQWVDFMMMPLMPSLNNRYSLENIELVAVPNLVLQLNDSRHFIISKSHPDGKAAFAAIQKGLSQLRKTGAIEKAYREAGFIPDLNSYTVINKAR